MGLVELFLSPRGRVGRTKFWLVMGLWLLVETLLRGGISAAARWSGDEIVVAIFFWAWVLFSVGTYFPILAISIKRLHDTGRSGHWMALPIGATASSLLLIVAIVRQALGSMLLLSLLCIVLGLASLILLRFWAQAGDAGGNEYGVA